jgi:hypothetical protein
VLRNLQERGWHLQMPRQDEWLGQQALTLLGTSLMFSERIDRLTSSLIRELLALTQKPDIISFAGGLPAREAMPPLNLSRCAARPESVRHHRRRTGTARRHRRATGRTRLCAAGRNRS